MVVVWEVLGGADKGGILVRKEMGTTSQAEGARLATGALVKELLLVGDRLMYEKLSGSGPTRGWVSTRLPDGKVLMAKTDKGPPAQPSESPEGTQESSTLPASASSLGNAESPSSEAPTQDLESARALLEQRDPNGAATLVQEMMNASPAPTTAEVFRLKKLQLESFLHPNYRRPAGVTPAVHVKLAKSLAEDQPTDASAQELLGVALCLDGKRKEGEEVWKTASSVGAQKLLRALTVMEDQKARGNVAFKDGKWEAACQAYTNALDADPSRVDREMASAILGNRSAANRKLARFGDALADAEESELLFPSYTKAKFRKGSALLELTRYEEALVVLREAKQQDPKLAGLDDWIERAQHWSFVKPKGHYAILEVPIDASQEDIKKAHRRLALKYHPDKASAEERDECEVKFKQLQEAYDALSDEKQREVYDFGRIKPKEVPLEEKPLPRQLQAMGYKGNRKGDGKMTCMLCGFRVPPELDAKKAYAMKKLHCHDAGHPGFLDG